MSGQKIYGNLQFWLLCASSYFFFSSFNMLLPELPGYLSEMGGADYKGFIIALFTLTAGLSRPISGKLTDTLGRIPVMAFGSFVCFFAGLLYPFALGVFLFLALRLFHGFSTGFKPTATNAYVADLAPPERRGEAMGVLGFFGSFGMASGPVLGSFISQQFSIQAMFYISSVFALLSLIVIMGMKESLPVKQKLSLGVFRIGFKDVIEPKVLPAAIVILLNVVAFGAIVTIVPDLSTHLGIKNKGLFYAIFTLSSLLIRIIGGKASDRFGRVPVLVTSIFLIISAMLLITFSVNRAIFYAAAVVYGLGLGINTPTAFAWTVDLSDDRLRGRAMATSFIAMEAGIGLGALLGSWLYGNDASQIWMAFLMTAVFSFLSLVYLYFYTLKHRRLKRALIPAEETGADNVY